MHSGQGGQDSFEELYRDLRSWYPPEKVIRFKRSHQKVTHVAHGWIMRVFRSCDAVLALRDAGYGTEAWPLRRAALEHVLALRWLAAQGDNAKDVVVRAHAEAARRRQEASSGASWISASWSVWDEVAEDGAKSIANITESNILTNVTERIRKYGQPADLASWLIETNNSHPGWTTASPYLRASPMQLLAEPRLDQEIEDAAQCAGRLLRALDAVNDMAEDPPWTNEITAAVARYALLGDRIPPLGESSDGT